MKAIGATNEDITAIFLIEAGLLGLVGGAIGTGIGLGIAKLGEILAQQAGVEMTIHISAPLIIGTLLFSIIVGTLSGLLPARSASKQAPSESLRYE